MSGVRTSYIFKIVSNSAIIIIAFLLFTFFSCNGDEPVTSNNPEIFDLTAPDSLIKGIPDTTMIYAGISDPQGLDDIDSVYFTVIRPDGSSNGYVFYMFDDGVNGGDTLADDGIYSQGIQSPDLNAQTGDYIFRFTARDLEGNLSGTIDKTITAYEYNSPVIRSVVINQYDISRQHLYLSAAVYDAQGRTDIQRVWVELAYLADSTDPGEFELNDLGISGDSTGADSRFSLNLQSLFPTGDYRAVFKAIDWDDNEAIPVDTTFIISDPSLLMR